MLHGLSLFMQIFPILLIFVWIIFLKNVYNSLLILVYIFFLFLFFFYLMFSLFAKSVELNRLILKLHGGVKFVLRQEKYGKNLVHGFLRYFSSCITSISFLILYFLIEILFTMIKYFDFLYITSLVPLEK